MGEFKVGDRVYRHIPQHSRYLQAGTIIKIDFIYATIQFDSDGRTEECCVDRIKLIQDPDDIGYEVDCD